MSRLASKRLERFIKLLYLADQKDRRHNLETDKLEERDKLRYAFARAILSGDSRRLSPCVLFCLAMILHRSATVRDLAKAQRLAKLAAAQGYPKAKWLSAATFDRKKIMQGKPQHYGTQFKLDASSGRWLLHPLDGLCGDEECARLGLPSISEIKNWPGV
jgi:hypothetical protein